VPVLAVVCLLAMSQTAFAGGWESPSYCDPGTDPYECACPPLQDQGLDACSAITEADIMSSDDPNALRAAAGITSQWDPHAEKWVVNIEAARLPGSGLLRVNTVQQGHWDTLQQLFDYVGALIGQELVAQEDANGNVEFPPLRINQEGVTALYDASTHEWAEVQSHSLIFDAITDGHGTLFVADTPIQLFAPGANCPGTDSAAYTQASSGNFSVEQCSVGDEVVTQIPPTGCPGAAEKQSCYALIGRAMTTLDTLNQWVSQPFQCEKVNGFARCKSTPGMFVSKRTYADELDIDSWYFAGGTFQSTDEGLSSATNVQEVRRGETGAEDGVCAWGTSAKGSNVVHSKTRDGSYDPSHPMCTF